MCGNSSVVITLKVVLLASKFWFSLRTTSPALIVISRLSRLTMLSWDQTDVVSPFNDRLP